MCVPSIPINTKRRSSRMRASCISTGTPSRVSRAFPFPFDLSLGTPTPEATREFSGARTNEVSAMKDGSSYPPLSTLPREEGTRAPESSPRPSSRYWRVRRTDAIVPVTLVYSRVDNPRFFFRPCVRGVYGSMKTKQVNELLPAKFDQFETCFSAVRASMRAQASG